MMSRRSVVVLVVAALVASVLTVADLSLSPRKAAAATATAAADSVTPGTADDGGADVPAATADARPDEVSAALAARLSGRRFEVSSMTTDSSVTYINPDGSHTLESSPEPYQAVVGAKWVPINTDLQPTAAGFAPMVAENNTVLSAGGTGPLASITIAGSTVSWSWPTPLPAPVLDGDVATYHNVGGTAVPGEDLQLSATPAGFELNVVLNQQPASSVSVPLTMTAPGLTVSKDSGGALHVKNSAGTEVATSTSPVVFDDSGTVGTTDEPDTAPVGTGLTSIPPASASKTPAASAKTPSAAGATATPSASGTTGTGAGSDTVTYTVPASYLQAADTDYPVTLDPGVTANLGRAHYAIVERNAPNNAHYDIGTPQIGTPTNNGAQLYRSFFQYNTAGIGGTHILSAQMNLGILTSNSACNTPTELDVRSTTTISPNTTWNSKPDAGPIYARYSSSLGYSSACPGGVAAITGSGMTDLVQAWANTAGTNPASVAELVAASEVSSAYLKSFNNAPNITITYNTPPPAPGALSVSSCFFLCGHDGNPADINSTTPTLSAQAYDQDGGTLQYTFGVYSEDDKLVASGSTSVTSPATASWQVPAGVLSDGDSYSYHVQAYDGIDYSPVSADFDFDVDTTAPAPPEVTADGFVADQWVPHGTTGDFSYSDGSDEGNRLEWSLDGGPWSGWNPTVLNTGPLSVGDGEHMLQVLATDDAANLSLTVVTFGVGAGLTSPHDQAQTAKFTPLGASGPSSTPYLTYQMRAGTTGTFATLDPSTVTIPGTSTHPTWPQSGTVSGSTATFPALTLDAKTALGADGVLQLRGCFATNSTGTGTLCDTPTTVQVAAQTASTGTADIGPGTVDETSGNFTMGTTDVSVTTATGTLSLGRSVSTVIANATPPGAAGVFGPGWTADLAGPSVGAGSLRLADHSANGYVILTDPSGNELDYTRSDPSQTTFTGLTDANDKSVLVANTATNPTQYTLTDTAGVATVWTGSGATWQVQSVTEPGAATTSYTYDGSGRVTRILAPVPTGLTCTSAPTTTVGCRSLSLVYATATAAQSDDPSGMTDYTGRLVAVDFTAANPATGVMTTIRVARYGYDSTGALIGQWDPRLSTPLVTRYSYSGGRLATLTPPGLKPYTFAYDGTGKLLTVTRHDDALNSDAVTRVVYGIAWNAPGTSSGLPDLSGATTATWGQGSDFVATGTAVFPPDHPASATPAAADWPYADLHYVDNDAREVDTASYGAGGWQIDATQYDDNGNQYWSLTAGNRAQALSPTASTDPAAAALSSSTARAAILATTNVYSADGTELIDSYGPVHPVRTSAGATVDARAHTHDIYDQGAPSTGGPYGLVTSETTSSQSVDGTATEYDPITTTTSYAALVTGDPTGWSLHQPTSTSVTVTIPADGIGTSATPAGSSSTLATRYRYDAQGRTVAKLLPGAATDANGVPTDARTTVTAYYTATGTGACVSAALAGLACSTGPAAQPSTGNALPVTTASYNIYGQALTKVQTAGSTVRTVTSTFDAAARPLTSATVVTPTAAGGTAIPTVTTGYSTTTGLALTQAAGGQTLTTGYDTQGRVTSYTDATGNVSTTSYDIDGRVASKNDGKATTTYTYNGTGEHRGLVTSEDSSSGFGTSPSVFSAAYDTAGSLATETYPSGLTATTTYDNTGYETGLVYARAGTTWLTFSQVSDAQGRTGTESSPLSKQVFGYDNDDRLVTVADTVSGSGTASCTTRVYTLDADSNRIGSVSYPDDGSNPTTGHCSTATAPSLGTSTYDTADRLTNTGYTYDTLGRTTLVPSADSKGIATPATGTTTEAYYANDMVASQTPSGSTLGVYSYTLDPAQNRVNAQTTAGSSTTTTNHYADGSDSPTWAGTSSTVWNRYVSGPDGTLAGVQTQAGVITLRLSDLHGNSVATVADATTATGVSSYQESTEYGAPRTASTAFATYGYLGSHERSSKALGGVILMGVRLYNTNTGRFLTSDPIPGGNDNPYTYVTNPIDKSDLAGTNGGPRPRRRAVWSSSPGTVANALGISVEAARRAIHAAKQADGKLGGKRRNPDVEVNLENGDIRIKGGDGSVIGNINDYLQMTGHAPVNYKNLAGAVGVGAAIWFIGKALAPACGPLAPVCFVAF